MAERDADEYDVAIVGGGPAGCSAAVFIAREGLDTVVFDRGRSSMRQCAHLENYLGFPEGIDIETFYALMHDHVEMAGCELVADLVESVERVDEGFVVEPQEREVVRARRVVAATRYGGEYLRGLDSEAAMFETHERDGETHETFDRTYADHDGTTPVEGLYIVSPSEEDKQAIMAAGRAARVAHRIIADDKLADGWWPSLTEENVDWVRPATQRDTDWTDRETWVEWFDDYYGEDAPADTSSERYQRVREAFVDDAVSSYISADEAETRARVGHETVAARLDTEAVVAASDEEELLDAIDDETIREYVNGESARPAADGG